MCLFFELIKNTQVACTNNFFDEFKFESSYLKKSTEDDRFGIINNIMKNLLNISNVSYNLY
jgi:hypothetical protein